MIPSIENLFKRGADLYYSRRHSYPLFEIEFRPSIGDEWIYEITIRGNNGKVTQYSTTNFNDNIIVSMIEGLLHSEDIANREYINAFGERVNIEPGSIVRGRAGINTITINGLTIINFDSEEEV